MTEFRRCRWFYCLFLVTMGFARGWAADTGKNVQAVTYSPHAAHANCHMNMGPTGANAWMRGYHFVVMRIDRGSPAHQALMPGDVVVGADGTAFGPEHDPRITLGNAIGRAEADGEPLLLTVLRQGAEQTVNVTLPPLGAFSATWPHDCPKSDRILDAACRSLILSQLPNGEIATDGNMGTCLGGLLFLASGDPVYLDAARRAAYSVADKEYKLFSTSNNWPMGYGGVLLAEYYLATGDDAVLPGLRRIADLLARGQMNRGGWGHTSPGGAYGTLNQVGIICAMALTLAAECGVDVNQEALERSQWFFSRYAELGAVPYGDHVPNTRIPDSNGRSASAGILMRLIGEEPLASAFVDSVAMSYWMREEGHTGGFFSMTWGPLAASMAAPETFRTFMDYQAWYYNLARTWRGELVLLPYHEALTRFDSSSYIGAGGDFTTGGLGLVYALPRKHLRILGAPASVFGNDARATDGALGRARAHYLAREWADCDKVLSGIDAETFKTQREKRWLTQLKRALTLGKAATERVLLEVESNLSEQAPYRARQQFDALKRRHGDEPDERFEALDKRFAGLSWYLREGEAFYEKLRGMYTFAVKSWVPQGRQARRMVNRMPTAHQPIWEPLSPVSDIVPQEWRTLLLDDDRSLPRGWMDPEFDDSSWIRHDGIFTRFDGGEGESYPEGAIAARRVFTVTNPEGAQLRVRLRTVRPAHTQVYLNGTRIVNAVRGQRGGYARIPLDASVFALLREGENLLAVTSTRQGRGGNHLDVGLAINRVPIEARVVPVRATALVLPEDGETDNTLRVREVKARRQQALRDSYGDMGVKELLRELGQSVAYRRHLAAETIVKKGPSAIEAALGHLADDDWKLRAGLCDVIAGVGRTYAEDPENKELALVRSEIPTLRRMLADPHYWVRVRAARALGRLGDPARAALPELCKRVGDSDEWVRLAAIRAVSTLHDDPQTAIDAATLALEQPNTAFRVPRRAYGILKKYPGKEDGRLAALATMLSNPPQGGGGRTLLKPLLEMAVTLDPDGDVMIPVLIDAARPGSSLSRQQANPRAKVVELLGAYGEHAKAAVPVLREILASDEKSEKSLHGAARKALAEMGVEVEAETSEAD